MTSWLDWVWLSIAAVAALLGLALLIRALFLDRAKGRKRCPKCWYDMSDHAARNELRCPECGSVAKSHKRLTKTRRHRKIAVLALLLLLIGLSGVHWLRVREDVKDRGWIAALPTIVLLMITPVPQEPTHRGRLVMLTSLQKEVYSRSGGLWDTTLTDRVWLWRIRRSISVREQYGVPPSDRTLIERMESDGIKPITGQTTVGDCFNQFSKIARIPIDVDWKTLNEWGVSRSTSISLPSADDTERTPATVLEELLTCIAGTDERDLSPNLVYNGLTCPLSWDIVGGVIYIERHGDHKKRLRYQFYSLDALVDYGYWHESQRPPATDIVFDQETAPVEVVRELISEFIDPNFLDWNFGTLGRFHLFERSILVSSSNRNLIEIERLLDELKRRIPRDKRGNFVLPTDPRRVRADQ